MKQENMTRCNFCTQRTNLQSPPLQEYYRDGRIEIQSGTVLLDVPNASCHVGPLDGYYCDLGCLVGYIKELRRKK